MQHTAMRIEDGGKIYELNAVLSDDGGCIIAATAQYYSKEEGRFIQVSYETAMDIAERHRSELFSPVREDEREPQNTRTRQADRGHEY